MKYGSVCSGIEAASVAWHPLGWEPQWFAEIDKFPSAVLAHHFPNVPNHGDMTRIPDDAAGIDILVGGTPCQSFSIAGLRGGLDDDRGNLALEYCRLADRFRPRWLVWENVPGALSSGGGRDFGAIIGAMVELGYSVAWRVLDAQYIRVDGHARAVPQRRRRVFVVGCLGGSRTSAAAVLFERAGMSGHPAPRREAGTGVARCASVGAGVDVSQCLTTGTGRRYDAETETLIAWDPNQVTSSTNRSNPRPGVCHTLPASPAVAFHARQDSFGESPESPPLDADPHTVGVRSGAVVRRLMPVECERLQGFQDGWTDVPYRGKPAADGPRYKAIGNSMAVNVMRWIGQRIAMADPLVFP